MSSNIIQLIVLPLIAIIALKVSLADRRLPKSILVVAIAGALFSFWHHITYPKGKTPFLIAPLEEDDLHKSSKLFREVTEEFLEKQKINLKIHPYPEQIRSQAQAQEILHRDPGIKAIAWGNKSYINVSFGENVPRNLEIHANKKLIFKVATWIPNIATNIDSEEATYRIIADLFAALREEPLSLNREMYLRRAGVEQARWANKTHRAYLFFLIGNYYLEKAAQNNSIEQGYLKCGEDAYIFALSLFREKQNSHLSMAIRNNLGVLKFIRGVDLKDPNEKKKGIKLLKRAKIKDLSKLHDVVEHNLLQISLIKKGK